MNRFKKVFREYKFEIFLATLVFNLFGILLFNDEFFVTFLFPIGLLLNIVAGINLISRKRTKTLISVLFFVTAFISGYGLFNDVNATIDLVQFGFYFLFYVVMTLAIVKQIWSIKELNNDLIYGVICGYITLGLVGFFIFLAIENNSPGSFDNASFDGALFADALTIRDKSDSLLYYSYITLMTIGYGEIVPVTTIAQKAAILLGMLGQFYVMIITAVVVTKYITYANK